MRCILSIRKESDTWGMGPGTRGAGIISTSKPKTKPQHNMKTKLKQTKAAVPTKAGKIHQMKRRNTTQKKAETTFDRARRKLPLSQLIERFLKGGFQQPAHRYIRRESAQPEK